MKKFNLQPASCKSREIAAIDLGSNSFHMIIARIVNGSIQVLSRLKQKVQLAAGLDQQGVLDQAAIDRGVACLALFAERLQGFDSSNVTVVGTYTLRSAVNKQDFLQQAAVVFPYSIHIISGETEAKMIYAGVSHTQPEQQRKLVIDIGGGSTEMIIGEGFTPLRAESRNMGCVSFAQAFFTNGVISETRFEQARTTAIERIADLAEPYRHLGWTTVLGSSGTIKTVSQVIEANLDPDGIITAGRLDNLIKRTLKATHFNELHLAGLRDDRADVFVPGLAILSALFDVYQIEQMRYSDGALREGIMYSLEQDFKVQDIRQRSAQSLIEQFSIDVAQAERVWETCRLLARQLSQWQSPEYQQEMLAILDWAAVLHEIGLVINYKKLQKHSAYLLQNLAIPGFDKEQQRLLSLLVRFYQDSFHFDDIAQFSYYQLADVQQLICILRLAVLLNKSRQATEKTQKIKLNFDRGFCQLEFDHEYLSRNPLIAQELKNEQRYWQEIGLQLNYH
ncbi:MAG: exopolyphosphatase [Pasteurellaceae bacterium]|nr:exopolyphosphatase [Pasteurellaceae bacterium]